jgi:hypothetical protein
MAGERGFLSIIETGNANMSDRTGQEGQNRKERIDRKGEKIQSSKEEPWQKQMGKNLK